MTKNEYVLYKELDQLVVKLDEDYGRLLNGEKSELNENEYDRFCCVMMDTYEGLRKYEKENNEVVENIYLEKLAEQRLSKCNTNETISQDDILKECRITQEDIDNYEWGMELYAKYKTEEKHE